MTEPARINLDQWDRRYAELKAAGLVEPAYGGPLRRHVEDGDYRLKKLQYDNSPAALRLWNFLLTEEDRLVMAKAAGQKIIAAMKDLGTVPVMAWSLPDTVAFYPDGAWWIPCIMENSTSDLRLADACGIDESFCPVRAMLGAFINCEHFPAPDLLICSVGATCDDFSAIAQRLESIGWPIWWWEIPARRKAEEGEEAVCLSEQVGWAYSPTSYSAGARLRTVARHSNAESGRQEATRHWNAELREEQNPHPNPLPRGEGEEPKSADEGAGTTAPRAQVEFVRGELEGIRGELERVTGHKLDDQTLANGIRAANEVRRALAELRYKVFTAERAPLPALELLIAEMLIIHFCSDRAETLAVYRELLAEVDRRMAAGAGVLPADAARVFWVNPVADLEAMNLLEDCGGRLCGTEFLFPHALDEMAEDLPPMEALARAALADPMVGPSADRAERIVRDARLFGAEAVVISRIPGASHCALEGGVIREMIRRRLDLPVLEIEVPSVSDGLRAALRNRLEALVETVRERRMR